MLHHQGKLPVFFRKIEGEKGTYSFYNIFGLGSGSLLYFFQSMEPMKKSTSAIDLLNQPVLSSSRSVSDYVIEGVGGGYVVVNTYGDYNLSIARLDVGVLGENQRGLGWINEEDALNHVFNVTACQAEKCIAAELKVGGAGILVYLLNERLNTIENRSALLVLASEHMAKLGNTSILCTSGIGTTKEDLRVLREASSTMPIAESKGDSPGKTRPHSYSEVFDCPVPLQMLETTDDLITKCGAYSAFGAIKCLIRAKEWLKPRVAILGITDVSAELYWLLTKKGYDVVTSSFNYKDIARHKIPSDRVIAWGEGGPVNTSTDILLLCCPSFTEKLTVDIVDTFQCNALLSLHDCVLPGDNDEKENVLAELDRAGIFDFCEGLVDLGGMMKAYSMAKESTPASAYKFADALNVGMVLMQKMLHLDGIVKQYDPEENQVRKFFEELVGSNDKSIDGNNPIRDIWDGVNISEIAVGVASTQMTEWMWNKARAMCPAYRLKRKGDKVNYLDLGAGDGTAARWICKQDTDINIKCINISRAQNAKNRELSDEEGLGGQISVETGTFERLDPEYSNLFDGCLSQDSFVHAFNRLHAFNEAYKVTKGGGWLLVSDLTCGEEEDIAAEEDLEAQTVTNWVTTSQYLDMARQAGWAEVQFVDMTVKIKISCQTMIKNIKELSEKFSDTNDESMRSLQSWKANLSKRIGQIDRGIFKWGIVAARKPYNVVFFQQPPVVPQHNQMIKYSRHDEDGCLKFGTDVVALTIKDRMTRENIENLPPTTRLIVTMSAGLDHIDTAAAKERKIVVAQAARDTISKSVADYLLSCIMFGLRGGFENIGVPFPGDKWDLNWNASGVDLDKAKIGFIGMGAIASETARRIRALSTECTLVYHIPEKLRSSFVEGTHRMMHVGIADLYSTCDVVVPMVPLIPATTGLIDYKAFTMMKRTALFVNMARGKVVSTTSLCMALKERLIRHAILDTTDPEPLPKDHEMWGLDNCTITPHFATNTSFVRKELVEDIPNQIEDALEGRSVLRLEEERMRKELSEAYHITRDFGMDELVWNHLSVMLSDSTFLITPGGRMFDDIGPYDLVKSSGNVTADIIHEAIYNARPDIKAIVHLHTPATVAVSCLEMGFVPLAQESAPFVGRVASYPWDGVSNDREEQELISDACKGRHINTLVMENHGFCTMGRSIGEAWVLAYYFDKSCQTQLNVLQTGQKIRYPKPEVLAKAAEQSYLPDFFPGLNEWGALRKMLSRQQRR